MDAACSAQGPGINAEHAHIRVQKPTAQADLQGLCCSIIQEDMFQQMVCGQCDYSSSLAHHRLVLLLQQGSICCQSLHQLGRVICGPLHRSCHAALREFGQGPKHVHLCFIGQLRHKFDR